MPRKRALRWNNITRRRRVIGGTSTLRTLEASKSMNAAMAVSASGMPRTSAARTPKSAMLTRSLTARWMRAAMAQRNIKPGSVGSTEITSPLPATAPRFRESHSCAIVAERFTIEELVNIREATARIITKSTATPCGISTVGRKRSNFDCRASFCGVCAGACGFGRRRRI